jgi:hypothetical protein
MTLSTPNDDKQNEKAKNKREKIFLWKELNQDILKKYFSFNLEFKFSLFRNYYTFSVMKF